MFWVMSGLSIMVVECWFHRFHMLLVFRSRIPSSGQCVCVFGKHFDFWTFQFAMVVIDSACSQFICKYADIVTNTLNMLLGFYFALRNCHTFHPFLNKFCRSPTF